MILYLEVNIVEAILVAGDKRIRLQCDIEVKQVVETPQKRTKIKGRSSLVHFVLCKVNYRDVSALRWRPERRPPSVRSRVVFLSFLISTLFLSFYRSIPTWNEVLLKLFPLVYYSIALHLILLGHFYLCSIYIMVFNVSNSINRILLWYYDILTSFLHSHTQFLPL